MRRSRDKIELLKAFKLLAEADVQKKMEAAADEQRELLGFVLKYDIESIDGLWYCGGHSWDARDYRVTMLVRKRVGGRLLCCAAEWRAATAEALDVSLRVFCVPPANIAELCESAACSPPRRRAR